MLDKQVYDLTESDINEHSVWYFPMDETVEDELTVRPLKDVNQIGDAQLIIKTQFIDSQNRQYLGYVYWGTPDTVDCIKPVMFTDESECISFWNGLSKPSWDEYGGSQAPLKEALPVRFETTAFPTIKSLSGSLKGLYYINDAGVTDFIF